MATTELTATDVASQVRPYVAKKTIGDITLSMDEARIHLRNGYWCIPISPSREPSPLFPYYESLADLEDEVQEYEGLKVTIASGNPLTD
jgi:hypothetical protein